MKKTNFLKAFLKHPMVTAIIGTLIGTVIGSLIAASVTATNVEKATVELMSKRLEIVEENDTLEEAINKVNKEVDKKNADIEEKKSELEKKDQEIAKLTEQLNDDTEIKKLNAQIEAVQQEKENLQGELDELREAMDKLQIKYDELEQKKYDEYMLSRQSMKISLGSIEPKKNEGVNTNNSGDVSVDKTSFTYFIDSGSEGETYVEYDLNNEYSRFEAKAYISNWAYQRFDSDSPRISNSSVSIQVKLEGSDSYQEIDSKSGLSADSKPVDVGGSLIGATRLRIVFRGGGYIGGVNGDWGTIIRLGEPALYRTAQ